jgi:hypothetical protein
VKPFIEQRREQIVFWHFLREVSPETKGPEIRLRFYGSEEKMREIRRDLDEELKLRESESPEVYFSHIFGAHGESNKEYVDEAGAFGERGWRIFRKFLMDSSETALRFIEDEVAQIPEKPLPSYINSFFHLLMNQLGPDPITMAVAVGPEVMTNVFISLEILRSQAHIHV